MFHHESSSTTRAAATARNEHPGPPSPLLNAPSPLEGGWHESSWELCRGLEVCDLGDDLPEEFLAPSSPQR